MQLRRNQTHPKATQLAGAASDEETDSQFTALVTENEILGLDTDLKEDLTQLETCLQTLPTEQQICLTLFYLEQKSYAEVAYVTGYDLKQVKSYLQNGRQMLKL